ncbi:hypothetical protein RhiirA1_465389 [Rhizophagus irregularis]|uniref:F-box domain-containing protein n=1 Tax=Rhizophagus irregularis TaxID=588596 RepID=A0A2N0RG46_9GLOM|nr:hypothetical protein RhiirA1_465389 [Rhizophagus irregularis]
MDIYSILDPRYAECHDIITNYLQDDLNTLYSCILVNRRFCRIFIPILWKNPFKFIKSQEKLLEFFNTIIHCLEINDKQLLIKEKLIKIQDLPTTTKAYFEYNKFIKEFELNPIQKGMRLWITKYITNTTIDGKASTRRIKNSVTIINKYIGKLFFNNEKNENQYETINIHYTDLLSGPNTLFNIYELNNYEKSLIKVNKLTLSFFHKNITTTNLLSIMIRNFLLIQNILSPNIQHLQISIDTTKQHSEFTLSLIKFIKLQNNLKSLLISPFCKKDYFYRDILNLNLQTDFTCSLFKQILLSSSDNLKSLKIRDIYCSFIKEVQQLCNLNLTHFHLIITKELKLVDLMIMLKNFHHLVHLKLSSTFSSQQLKRLSITSSSLRLSINSSPLNNDHQSENIFKLFSQSFPPSLKILEIDFLISENYLQILLFESKFNLQCLKLYGCYTLENTLLRSFINYQKRNNCFKELGIDHYLLFNLSERSLKEAQNYFRITKNTSIDVPFYDIPIKNSPWSGCCNERKTTDY